MKTTKKALLALVCAAALVFGSVFATYAYLTSTTGVVTNTFSVGNVTITLDEAPVDVYGKVVEGKRVTENAYKLIPGHTYVKDPIVHVTAGSEKCYVFVKVADGIAAIEDATTIANQMTAKGWKEIKDGVYYYKDTVDASKSNTDIDVPVFDNFKVKGEADVADYASAKIEITAYAVQADGFGSAAAAWDATFGKPAETPAQ